MDQFPWDAYLDGHEDTYRDELVEFLSIPSVSTAPEHAPDVQRAATWVASRLRRAGFPDVKLLPTVGHPVVYGRWISSPAKPRLLIYGHYDVQPPEPLDLWATPPFQPASRGDKLFARGSADMKSSLLSIVHAIEALAVTKEELPIDLIVLFEGEEEIGSPNLPGIVHDLNEELKPDFILSGDGGMFSPDRPSLVVGLKGIAGCQINLRTGNTDLHSGLYGATVPNAVNAVAHLAATFHNADGSVAIEGFYDDVRPLTAFETEELSTIPFDAEAFRFETGANMLVGEQGYTVLEQRWTRPTIDFNGMWGGFQGAGAKTVTPCEAHLKITSRLVPDQSPEKILELIERHVEQHTPCGAEISIERWPGCARPFLLSRDDRALAIAANVLRQIYGQDPLFVRSGGTVPITEVFTREFGVGTVSVGFAMPGSRAHAPNEWIRLSDLSIARRTYAALFTALGKA